MILAPSILSADFSKLLEEVKEINSYGATFLHIDVMDGHFVPNISLGALVYKWLKNKVDMVFDVHLMISEPNKYALDFVKAGADYLTFHYEAVNDVTSTIEYIKSLGVRVGISIKPNTDVKVLDDYLSKVDLVLVMSVEPGFGGQGFMPNAIEKIEYLAKIKKEKGYTFLIEVDGGINLETGKKCKEAGVEILVAGSYVFGAKNRELVTKGLIKL